MAREHGWLDDELGELRDDAEFQTYGVLIHTNERICERMEALGMSRADLARKLGTSRAAVTRMLNGAPNMTLKRLVRVAMALDADVEVQLVPRAAAGKASASVPREASEPAAG